MAYLPPLNGGRLNANISGNTAGASTLLSSGTMVLAGGNNVTLSQNGNTISFNAAGAAQASINFSASNTSANLASLTFSNSNGVSFGLNAGVLTASYTTPAAATNVIGASTGNVSGNVGVISSSNFSYVFSGGNNVTLSQSVSNNSATLGISGPSYSNSNNVSFGTLLSNNNAYVTANASFNQTQQTTNIIQQVQASGSTLGSGTLSFANANSITFGMNGGTITASANPDGIQGVYAGTGAQASLQSMGTVSFSNSNNVSFGLSNGIMTASAAGGGAGLTLTAPGASFSSGSVNFSVTGGGAMAIAGAGNSINFSVPATSLITATNITMVTNGNTIGFSAPPMFDAGMIGGGAGSTLGVSGTTNTGGIAFVAGSNVTLSQSITNSGATMTINAGGAAMLARWEYPREGFNPLAAASNGVLSIQRINVPFNVVGNSMKIGGSISLSSSAAAGNASVQWSMWMGVYTLNGSNLSLASFGSTNNSFSALNSNGGASSTALTGITGMRQLTVPINVSMTPGDYWVAAVMSSVTSGTNLNPGFTIYGNANLMTNNLVSSVPPILTPIGANSAVSARDVLMFQGFHTSLASSGPASIVGSLINNTASTAAMRAAFYHVIYSATY